MSKLSNVDKNLVVPKGIDAPDCVFHDVKKPPFDLYGLCPAVPGEDFRRVPEDVAKATSEAVSILATNTAGGRVRFTTDSEYVAISVKVPEVSRWSHMPKTGSCGFDMYVSRNGSEVFAKTFIPPVEFDNEYQSIHHFGTKEAREITINFPLYNPVSELYVGIESTASLSGGGKYKFKKPVVYYGSSITQGGCASRPGNCYEAFISQKLSCDYINLGFSGSAKAEAPIIDYIANLDMSVFVYDYDHNAPTAEYLRLTHEKGYKKIREKNPDLPIILVSAPVIDFSNESMFERRGIVMETYVNALNNGDKNIQFVDGYSLFDGEFSNSCTVDGCHPTDLGFFRMATVIGKCVEAAIR